MAMRNCKNCHQPREDHVSDRRSYKTLAACNHYRERKARASEKKVMELQAFWKQEHPRGPQETLVDYESRMPKRLELRAS